MFDTGVAIELTKNVYILKDNIMIEPWLRTFKYEEVYLIMLKVYPMG